MKRLKMRSNIAFKNRQAVVIAAALLLAGQGGLLAAVTPFSQIIVFGDSVSDNGNFYSMSIDAWGAENAYPPSPPYWSGRFCNGKIWAEFLAEDLGMAGLLKDYAVGGATSGTENYGSPFGGVQHQIAQYLENSEQADPNALYILWAGHNDIFMALPMAFATGDAPEAREAFVENTINNILALCSKGARHILVPNILDVGKIPAFTDPLARELVSALVFSFNEELEVALNELEEDVFTIAVDASAFMNYVAAHPEQFGFSNVTDQGIFLYPDEPSGYLFWDDAHLTTQWHRIFDQFAVRNLIDYYSPRRGKGVPPALVNSLNGLVRAGKGN